CHRPPAPATCQRSPTGSTPPAGPADSRGLGRRPQARDRLSPPSSPPGLRPTGPLRPAEAAAHPPRPPLPPPPPARPPPPPPPPRRGRPRRPRPRASALVVRVTVRPLGTGVALPLVRPDHHDHVAAVLPGL